LILGGYVQALAQRVELAHQCLYERRQIWQYVSAGTRRLKLMVLQLPDDVRGCLEWIGVRPGFGKLLSQLGHMLCRVRTANPARRFGETLEFFRVRQPARDLGDQRWRLGGLGSCAVLLDIAQVAFFLAWNHTVDQEWFACRQRFADGRPPAFVATTSAACIKSTSGTNS
jgi:hypothetical protein